MDYIANKNKNNYRKRDRPYHTCDRSSLIMRHLQQESDLIDAIHCSMYSSIKCPENLIALIQFVWVGSFNEPKPNTIF